MVPKMAPRSSSKRGEDRMQARVMGRESKRISEQIIFEDT